MRRHRRGLVAAALAVTVGVLSFLVAPTPAWAATFNVRDFGATGNGSTNDTAAINRAIQATSDAPGINILRFPSGTYRSANSIHMRSGVTIQLDAGATIMGASSDDYDPPESNPNDDFQDYGHSHFHNAMIWATASSTSPSRARASSTAAATSSAATRPRARPTRSYP